MQLCSQLNYSPPMKGGLLKMENTVIDRLHTEFSELIQFLSDENQITLQNLADEHLRKTLLLACASYFERCLTDSILEFTVEVTSEQHVIKWLVEGKTVRRQYHSWFNWDSRNANHFFAMFGSNFKAYMQAQVSDDRGLEESIRAFLEIGRERNRLVHNDFGNSPLEKTSREIYDLYRSAKLFVNSFPKFLKEYSDQSYEVR